MVDALTWISGASYGIGAALAATVPFEGRVVDISRSGGTEGTEHLRADLADPEAWPVVASHFASELERFDGDRAVFIHSAGVIEPIGFAGEVDDDAYRTNVILNSAAPQVLGHAFLGALRRSGFAGRADLLMLSSGAAKRAYTGWTAYSAGKAAIDTWVAAAGKEQAERGGPCRVLALVPGPVATNMQERILQTPEHDFPSVTRFQELYETGQMRTPEKAAKDVWAVLDLDFDNGAVVDVRELNL